MELALISAVDASNGDLRYYDSLIESGRDVKYLKFKKPNDTILEICNGRYVEMKNVAREKNFMVIDDDSPTDGFIEYAYINNRKFKTEPYATVGDLINYTVDNIGEYKVKDVVFIKILEEAK